MRGDTMEQAAARVAVIDIAGRVVAHPARHAAAISTAEIYALALGFEAAWAVAIEAHLLVAELERSDGVFAALDQAHADRIAAQIGEVRAQTERLFRRIETTMQPNTETETKETN